MHRSVRRSSCHLYPLVGVRLCQLLACHLPVSRHMVLSSHWRQIGMRSPSSLTATQTVTPSTLTVAHRGSLVYESLRENRNHTPWNERTRIATGLVTRTVTKIVIGPKRVTAIVIQNGPAGVPHYTETTVIAPATVNTRGRAGRTVHPIATKASRDAKKHQSFTRT